jgi:hypothetical protein
VPPGNKGGLEAQYRSGQERVGVDEGTPVTEVYPVSFKFTGKIAKVTIDLKEMQTADREEAEQSHKEAALKTALSDQRVSLSTTPHK